MAVSANLGLPQGPGKTGATAGREVRPASRCEARQERARGPAPRVLLTAPGAMGPGLRRAGIPFPPFQAGPEGAVPGTATVLPAPSGQPADPRHDRGV